MSAKSPIVLLRAYLDQTAARGVTRVPVRASASEALENLVHSPPAKRSSAAPRRVFEQPKPLPPPQEPARPIVRASADVIAIDGSSLEEKLAKLAAMAEADPVPRSLGSLRDTMVFAVGNPHARLMFIGEAPGADEERQREPFVGAAGQKLTQIIEKAMEIPRADVYITNICKFRPSTGDGQGMSNRPPSAEEMQTCIRYVLTEIDLIRPQVIVALGATALQGLGIQGPVGRMRGRFHDFQGIPVMATYHPSYIIRQEKDGQGNEAKRAVWEDMLMVMERLGMPISAKQRGYFAKKA